MDRFSANVLRVLGIIAVAVITIALSFLLFLNSFCAAHGDFGGRHPRDAGPWMVMTALVFTVGLWLMAALARGMKQTADTPAEIARAIAEKRAVGWLRSLLMLQIILSAAVTFFDLKQMWPGSRPNPPIGWLWVAFALRELPYAMLYGMLWRRIGPRTLACCISVPLVMVFFYLPIFHPYVGHPMGTAESMATWAGHIAILVFAIRVVKRSDLTLDVWLVFATGGVAFFYMVIAYAIAPFYFLRR